MPNKNLGKRIISSKLLLILSLSVLVFFTVNLTKTIINRQDLLMEIRTLEQEIDDLESRSQEFSGLIEYFKTIDFVESEARTKLNLRKPGEKIIIVPPQETLEQQEIKKKEGSALINTAVKDLNNFKRWWNYFFKIS